MIQPGRKYSAGDGYRYGFNGKEKDSEIKGEGNTYDFGARIYDNRLGRWFSRDPLAYMYPNMSDYSFGSNSPIFIKDEGGTHLRDANGNIIYTFTDEQGLYDDKTKRTIFTVYVYANDGSKQRALLYVPDNREEMKGTRDLLYFCHGYTQMEGRLSPESGPPIEGLLKGDRGGKLNEVGIKDAKAGDIAIFRVTQEMIDIDAEKADAEKVYKQEALGLIIHSAILNEDGTYSSKNGFKPLQTDASLESLQKLYGKDVTFIKPAENIKLEALNSKEGWNGIVNYSEKEVQEALAKQPKASEAPKK